MQLVSMSDATAQFSRLLDAIEQGVETEFVISRNGKPAARLVSLDTSPKQKHLGVAKGVFVVQDDMDADVSRLFTESKD